MNEKVLGFKEDEADIGQHPDKRDGLRVGYLIMKDKLVPVVSVERHEKIIEALNKSHLKDTAFLIKLRADERRKVEKWKKALKAVRLQAKKEVKK